MSRWLASIDLTHEMPDEKSRKKLKGKIKWLESKLKKEREFHRTILDNYEDEAVWDIEGSRYRMHLYQYKQKICQCKILLVHTGSIHTLNAIPPSFTSSVELVASPTQCANQLPSQGSWEIGQSLTAERGVAEADALAAMQQITQRPPHHHVPPQDVSL